MARDFDLFGCAVDDDDIGAREIGMAGREEIIVIAGPEGEGNAGCFWICGKIRSVCIQRQQQTRTGAIRHGNGQGVFHRYTELVGVQLNPMDVEPGKAGIGLAFGIVGHREDDDIDRPVEKISEFFRHRAVFGSLDLT